MIKKTFIGLLFIIASTFSVAFAQKSMAKMSDLPAMAQKTLTSHLQNLKVSYIETEMNMLGRKTYEVNFQCGAEADFDHKGKLESIQCPAGVPIALIPSKVQAFLLKNYKDIKVTSMDIDSEDTEVKLANGLELKFTSKGDFMKMDD